MSSRAYFPSPDLRFVFNSKLETGELAGHPLPKGVSYFIVECIWSFKLETWRTEEKNKYTR